MPHSPRHFLQIKDLSRAELEYLLARARQCQKERGKLPNILAVDFAMTGDVVGVAAEMNGLATPGAPR